MSDTAQQTLDKITDVLTNLESPGGEAGVLIGLARERLNSAAMILRDAVKAETLADQVSAIETAQAAPDDATADPVPSPAADEQSAPASLQDAIAPSEEPVAAPVDEKAAE